MTRKLFRFWLIALLLGPGCALALDIGEIQVHSALNQLFDARIPLPALTPEQLDKVSVRLAPAPMFKEFGLERAAALTNLVFSIEYNAEGQVYVRVVSTKPIREPSLGLLLEFGWPRGKTFREFTVLLDPVQRLAQRPGDRSKTVLDTPAAAPPPSAPPAVAPAPESKPELEPAPSLPTEDSVPPEVAAMTGSPPVEPPGKPLLPVEAKPVPVRIYRPGDTYGPVAVGEGLWAIALKVRPDPGITRDQMAEALFKANRHAFGKTGISGLKSGSMLRIPSFQEIADLTGSTTARHLAGIESSAVAATSPAPALVAMESPAAKVMTSAPEVFPLEPPASLEPTVVESSSLAPTPPTTQPDSAAGVAGLGVVAPSVGPVVVQQPELIRAARRRVALAFNPTAAGAAPEFNRRAPVPTEPAAVAQEPVSVTPLLFLAISEMVATLTQPPAMTTLTPVSHGQVDADVGMPEPERKVADATATPSEAVSESVVERAPVSLGSWVEKPTPAPIATLEPPVAPMAMASRLAMTPSPFHARPQAQGQSASPLFIRGRSPGEREGWGSGAASFLGANSPFMELEWLSLTNDGAVPLATAFAEPLPGLAIPDAAAELPAPLPGVNRAVETPAANVVTVQSVSPSPQAGAQYGPVASNERLWDIATKVRPDPGISKEHMMKALLKANPQAFAKAGNMGSLKVGATLRIPTVREIADYTGSKAARQLLEQQPTAAPPPAR